MNITKFVEGKKLNDVELRVLQYIVDNIDNVMNIGVRGIAKDNYTSTSVIMRLTKKLGYTGFIDMYYKIYPFISKEPKQNNSAKGTIQDNVFSTTPFQQFNNDDSLKQLAQHISDLNDKFFFVYATGFSAIVAEYIHKKLLVLGKKSMLATGSDSAGVFENNLSHVGIFFAVSKSGQTRQVVNKAITAKENGIFIVSFTNEQDNPLAELSDINFKIEDKCKFDDLNIFPNPFFPNVLMLFENVTYEYHQLIRSKELSDR